MSWHGMVGIDAHRRASRRGAARHFQFLRKGYWTRYSPIPKFSKVANAEIGLGGCQLFSISLATTEPDFPVRHFFSGTISSAYAESAPLWASVLNTIILKLV